MREVKGERERPARNPDFRRGSRFTQLPGKFGRHLCGDR